MIKILFADKTPHHNIRVVEEDGIRKLLFGNGLCQEQSAINLNNLNEHVYDYSRLTLYSLFFIYQPVNILVVGLGGAVIPNQFSKLFPDVKIDILELDPEVFELSKKYFNFKESENVKVHIGDAFVTISELKSKYDIIVLDVFNSRYIPFHIMSMEFLVKVNWALNNGGVVVVNTCNDHPSFYSHINTMVNSFLNCSFYREDGPNNNLTSMIFISKNLPINYVITRMVIDDKITNAKILNLKNIVTV